MCFDMDLCGVASIPGILRTSINNRPVAQMRLAGPQDRNIDDAIAQDWVPGEGRGRHLVSPAKGGV